MIAQVLIVLVSLLHVFFLVLEMFLWRGRARRIFGMTAEEAEATAVLAGKQGLYNGFLAAGLFWAHFSWHAHNPDWHARAVFFLVCVVIAGIYGGFTASKRILFVQALPAVLALIALYL